MDIYTANLTGLLGLCGVLFAVQRGLAQPINTSGDEKKVGAKAAAPWSSQRSFLTVYTLVMAADWLQGPFLYSLYTEEHGVPPRLVPALFTTGFAAGAASASVVGSLADRHGRKAACLTFCAAYALSCLLTAAPLRSISSSSSSSNNLLLVLLFAGRALGGLATSLLFSVFETWMVADLRARRGGGDSDGSSDAELSRTFGRMSTLNSLAAIASGVASEWLVAAAGTRRAPFLASAALLGVAAWIIAAQWEENYGDASAAPPEQAKAKGKREEDKASGSKLWQALSDPRVLALGLASTMFEGSMYLFVFLWTPALRSVSGKGHGHGEELPYGIIFASFMAATLAAGLAWSGKLAAAGGGGGRLGVRACAWLLVGLLGGADVVFYALARMAPPSSSSSPSPPSFFFPAEQIAFWLFCAFEACVGAYWPCVGYLRGRLVDDAVRAQVYGLLRVPLNVFVVAALLLLPGEGEGEEAAWASVFSTCSALLLAAVCGMLAALLGLDDEA